MVGEHVRRIRDDVHRAWRLIALLRLLHAGAKFQRGCGNIGRKRRTHANGRADRHCTERRNPSPHCPLLLHPFWKQPWAPSAAALLAFILITLRAVEPIWNLAA